MRIMKARKGSTWAYVEEVRGVPRGRGRSAAFHIVRVPISCILAALSMAWLHLVELRAVDSLGRYCGFTSIETSYGH